jgi:hypothetical protein
MYRVLVVSSLFSAACQVAQSSRGMQSTKYPSTKSSAKANKTHIIFILHPFFLALYIPSIQVGYMRNMSWRTGEVLRVKCVLPPKKRFLFFLFSLLLNVMA